ncbi:iron-containing alcohol dehydrogenase [Paraburkholderia unamae]|uniref:Iron-containing alcohol dehydrogenase n=2 Tax=Paraburkholderia TaxID=1822464 RepID=A0ACC6RTG4_9BURK
MLHGENVAFWTLCLLMLENRPIQEIEEMIRFCEQVGLPTTLAELGLTGDLRYYANRIAEASLAEGESTHACPVDVSVALVSDSILAVDATTTRMRAARH